VTDKTLIEFRSDDLLMKRAENIILALGFITHDHYGLAARLAGLMATYEELDRKVAASVD
jgi:hypothetical protein